MEGNFFRCEEGYFFKCFLDGGGKRTCAFQGVVGFLMNNFYMQGLY